MEIKLAIGAIIGAIIALLGNRLLESRKQSLINKHLVNSLFGELSHTLQHYSYSCYIPNKENIEECDIYEIKKSLAFTKYGEFSSSKNFEKFGFLNQESIKNLLQLAFRIRNTDFLIEQLLEKPNEITLEKLNDLNSRKKFICNSTEGLLGCVVSKNQHFESVFNKILHEAHANSVRYRT